MDLASEGCSGEFDLCPHLSTPDNLVFFVDKHYTTFSTHLTVGKLASVINPRYWQLAFHISN